MICAAAIRNLPLPDGIHNTREVARTQAAECHGPAIVEPAGRGAPFVNAALAIDQVFAGAVRLARQRAIDEQVGAVVVQSGNEFDPVIIKKYEKTLGPIEDKIIIRRSLKKRGIFEFFLV